MPIYLDNITTTKPSLAAITAMIPFFEDAFGALSSPHAMGQSLLPEIEKSLRTIYDFVHASDEDQCVVTSCGAEAVSQIIFSVYKEVTKKEGKNHFVTSSIDEAPAILALSRLEDEGCYLRMAQVTQGGYVTEETVIEALTPRTALVSLSWACALTGVVQPIEQIAKLCTSRNILLHVDATHALGKLTLYGDTRPDYITFNGEQLHAPKGIGMIIAKKNAPLLPLISGEEDTIKKRGGALNMPLLAALAQAVVEARQNQDLYCLEVARLRDKFEKSIVAAYPEAHILFHNEERLPHCSTIAFPGIKSEALAYVLNRKGVYANMGGGAFQQMEIVLKACAQNPLYTPCALSFSLSKYTTEQEIDEAVAIICQVASRLRRASKEIV